MHSYDGAVAHNVILTTVYVAAVVFGLKGAWLAIRAVWVTVELRIVNNNDGTAVVATESFETVRLHDYRRQRAKLPHWRRMATDAQLLVAAGVILGGAGSIAWLWWPSP